MPIVHTVDRMTPLPQPSQPEPEPRPEPPSEPEPLPDPPPTNPYSTAGTFRASPARTRLGATTSGSFGWEIYNEGNVR